MAATKPALTLHDLLNRDAPTINGPAERNNSPLGDREAIEKRTRFMRDKVSVDDHSNAIADKPQNPSTEESAIATESAVELARNVVKQATNRPKPPLKSTCKASDDKITRSIQFSRITYRQMEKTLNFIAYKSGRRNVSFPKYFEKLHELARQNPDLMNQLIDHFKTDSPD